MIIVLHRINTVNGLKTIPPQYGVEVDVRTFKDELVLNHEPFLGGELLEDYLREYHHRFIIFNVKEAGIEDAIHACAKKFHIENYFLLDVESPYIYRAAKAGEKRIAIRYSEYEPLEIALHFKNETAWVWIDTFTQLPIDVAAVESLKGFKTALVSPDRWGRPEDISRYAETMKAFGFVPNLVMTSAEHAELWQRLFAA